MSDGPITVRLRTPHAKQKAFLDSTAKRIVIRAGRRGGKTVGIAIRAVRRFLAGKRVLYAAPTQDQVETFWWEVKRALGAAIDAGILYKNEALHLVELKGTKQRIRAKTAWNADSLRGDYADDLILDEWQLTDEQAWDLVGAPMLLDNDGDAVFIYTPPSLQSRSISKARDPRHAPKLFKKASQDQTGRWATFNFSSHENPHISRDALDELASDMTALGFRQEILAEDVEKAEGALWDPEDIDKHRVTEAPELVRIVVGVDPAATSGASADMTGIITAGKCKDGHVYVLDDSTVRGTPHQWATSAIGIYDLLDADRIIGEINNGGEMVEYTLRTVDANVSYKAVHASRGKQVRAEPVAAKAEQGKIHHVGFFPDLEDELVTWVPGKPSPNRLDALVWAVTELLGLKKRKPTPRVWFPGMEKEKAQ